MATIGELESQVEEQQRLLEEVVAEKQRLERENRRLADELQILIDRFFRKKSERMDPRQLQLFLEQLQDPEAQDLAAELAPETRRPRKGHGRSPFRRDLPRWTETLEVPVEERHCDTCGRELKLIGEEITERGHLVPTQMVVKRYVRPKLACPEGHQVKTADLPPSLIDRCKYEPSVYAHLAVAKYLDHQPLHRLEGIYRRHGFQLPKSTMWEMLSRVDEVVAAPIVAQMRQEVLQEAILHGDETPVTVRLEQRGGSKKAYLWCYGAGKRWVFDFTMTRERDGPCRFLGDWSGTFLTDGYSGYDEIVRRNRLIRAGCWSHARRKFKDALDAKWKDAARLLVPIQRLFRIESAAKKRAEDRGLHADQLRALRQAVRQRRSRRVLATIEAIAQELRLERSTTPKSMLGKALTYLHNQWEPLTRFLDDPDLPLHNNDAERALRHVVTGRKNWMFYGSPRGGEVSKHLHSLALACRAAGINAEEYLEDVIRRIDTTPASEIASLTPWAWAEAHQPAQAPSEPIPA